MDGVMDSKYTLSETNDGSFTLFSKQYNQCYHSTRDGAFTESLQKHVKPCIDSFLDQETLTILDICFGLGFNTLTTLWYNKYYAKKKALRIYSPELDDSVLFELKSLQYPKELQEFIPLLLQLIQDKKVKYQGLMIELFIGDARDYIKGFENFFDIVYQDPFSPDENPALWTVEYFKDIKKALKPRGVLSTYSTALKTRLALDENGFTVYWMKKEGVRNFTLATLDRELGYEKVDVAHKKNCNPDVTPLVD